MWIQLAIEIERKVIWARLYRIRWMHSELILSFAKKVVNTNLDILALWAAANLQIAINWQYCKPIFDFWLQNRHFGVFWPQKAPNWGFLGQKSPKKKVCLKMLKIVWFVQKLNKIFLVSCFCTSGLTGSHKSMTKMFGLM